ncbi:MAG TPA: hypothetical protein VGH20_03860 [Myxococcales bacterium]
MPWLPYDTFKLTSPLPPDEVCRRLADAIEPRAFTWRGQGERRAFTGKLRGEQFDVTPVVRGRNSFAPRVRGTVAPGFDGTQIEGTMSLHPLVLAFVVFWSGGVLYALFRTWSAAGATFWAGAGPLFMLGFGWVLSTGAFTAESRRVHRRLAELFDVS